MVQAHPADAEYRVADLEVLSAGADLMLVHSRDSGAAGYYRPEVVELLTSLRSFGTLDAHLRNYLADHPGLPAGPVQRELVQLHRAGFLTRRDEVLADADAAAASSPAPITTLGIPTRDRIELLHRALGSYAENCARHGRQVSFVVVDDSPAASLRDRCRAMLAELGRQLGLQISYAGRSEKEAFLNELAEAGQIPLRVARYACLGERPDSDHQPGLNDQQPGLGGLRPAKQPGLPTIGANRNSLLLHTVGERIFSADDDTVCRLAGAPEPGQRLLLSAGANPLETWFFADRAAAFAAMHPLDADLLGLHEQFLGRPPAAVLAAAGPRACWDQAEPPALRRLRSRPGRILVTGNGTVGDCGWDNPDFVLFTEGASFRRLTRSAEDYRRARSSRDLAQVAAQPTITEHPDPRVAMGIGLDNTELLAPFPPVGRAEEVGFGAILARCFPDSYGAQLPWLIQHDPVGERRFADRLPFAIGLGSWLPACVDGFDPGPGLDPAGRLRGLGGYLADLGRLPADRFDDFARHLMWQSMSALIAVLTERLDAAEPAPDLWAADARRFIAAARRQAVAPVTELYATEGGRQSLQRSLVLLGELLTWWPRLVATARELRAAGRRLAIPVTS
jgi:hypothetical protein